MSILRNRVYYQLKPFIPRTVRRAVRRRLASRLRRSISDIWPIMPGSEQPPQNWSGWPHGKRFAAVLTHDVESAAGLEMCRQLMQLEMTFGVRSSFNFIPEGDYKVPAELRAELVSHGFEVGIHDLRHDGQLFASRRKFSRNAMRINSYLRDWNATGFRAGFMLHELDWLHELDIQYRCFYVRYRSFRAAAARLSYDFSVLGSASNRESRITSHESLGGFSARLCRTPLHITTGFHTLSAAPGTDDRYLAAKTGLDRQTRWNGSCEHSSGLPLL